MAQSCDNWSKNTNVPAVLSENDSVTTWISASKNSSLTLEQRKQLLTKAYHYAKTAQMDSLQHRKLTSIAFQSLKLGDLALFKTQNAEALTLATRRNDSFAMGDAHWNYASYYNKGQVFDSAYHHFNTAADFFEKSGHVFELAKMLYGMAFIKGCFKDYSGSEVLTFRAIKKFKRIEDYKSLFSCYNHLGQLQKDVYEYDKALFYYDKAIENLNKLKNSSDLQEAVLNNIGNIYIKKGDYSKALQNFNKLLEDENLKFNKDHYARTLDNMAYCRLLIKDTLHVAKKLNEALQIRERLDNKSGIIISKIHLARYYTYAQDSVRAIAVAKEANRLAKDIKNNRDYLETLLILANLDLKNASIYLERYINFSDSLQVLERKIQNKFTRIAFETDEYIEESERLAEQKVWIVVTVAAAALILSMFLLIWIQKSRNKLLLFENEQQKANEQVYLITLKQQEKLETEKIKERNRISEELHDGVLGKLFGTRMNLGFLEIKGDKNTLKQHQKYIDELQIIEKEIRDVSHKLSDNINSTQISFSSIIKDVLENKSKLGNFKYTLTIDASIEWHKINQVFKVNLFRIIQEALQNILKHAFAKKVKLNFETDKKNLVLIIKDDGIGFDNNQNHKGIGMKNIQSRVKKLNGILKISSEKYEGTILTIKIPKT
jgi:two-component system, NarL family, sensor kinase